MNDLVRNEQHGKLIRNDIVYSMGAGYAPVKPTEFYLNNGLVGDENGAYITTNLDKEILNGTPLFISLYDTQPSSGGGNAPINSQFLIFNGTTTITNWSPGNQENYELTLTSTTAGLTRYRGSYRKIYAKISKLNFADGQIYEET